MAKVILLAIMLVPLATTSDDVHKNNNINGKEVLYNMLPETNNKIGGTEISEKVSFI